MGGDAAHWGERRARPGTILILHSDSFEGYGVLKDEKGTPVAEAKVNLFSHEDSSIIVRKNILAQVITDFDGKYRVAIAHRISNVRYGIEFSYREFTRVYTHIPYLKSPIEINGNMVFEPREEIIEQVIRHIRYPLDPPGQKTTPSERIEHAAH